MFSSSFLPAKGTPGYFTEWQQAPADDSRAARRVQREVHASGGRAWHLAEVISEEHSDGP